MLNGFILLFGISGGELLIIFLLAIVVFGPSKIPEIARMIAKGVNEVKKVQREINTEINRYSGDIEREARQMQRSLD
ncbi:MAG TPA: twin-arginine translocase TatA/TatE family subunit, partial [Bacteroidales bacterium]|nr:twin-arginine translocase TatA/TatE family subunit [Bacteroidales bacterium]